MAEPAQILRWLWSGDRTSFTGADYRFDKPEGYLRADPAPPIVIGGFGPRMAGIVGKHGDGFNTQARHLQLARLADIARDEHKATRLRALQPERLRGSRARRRSHWRRGGTGKSVSTRAVIGLSALLSRTACAEVVAADLSEHKSPVF